MKYTSTLKAKIYKLFSLYPDPIEFIPADDPFRFLITVVLSASSTDERAIKASTILFDRAHDARGIAELDESEIESMIAFVGLGRSKAHSIKALAEKECTDGIPKTLEELVKLPGIGEKTANCYLVSVLGQPGVIVDTHFARVSHRLGLVKSEDRNAIYKEVKDTYPDNIWSRLSMTVNKHGRVFCLARKPKCGICPMKELCDYGRKVSSVE